MMYPVNALALSDSTTLSSVLAGLTNLVELNLYGTKRRLMGSIPRDVSDSWSGGPMLACGVHWFFSRPALNIGHSDGSDLLRFLLHLSQLKSLDLGYLYSGTHALARFVGCVHHRNSLGSLVERLWMVDDGDSDDYVVLERFGPIVGALPMLSQLETLDLSGM